ncbi:glycosyltransferase [Tatumella punctata]|uniref:Glycosyltransferase n=1 Tax=Tatumella punctata TaxID=399969 RepID=A0ABW1VQC5_9GAMM
MDKLSAVIITYYPDIEYVNNFVSKISSCVDNIVIVDNTGDGDLDFVTSKNSCVITNNINEGIAYAQNQGIIKSLQLNSEFIFIFDQDSDVEPDFFIKMLSSYKKNSYRKISCLGPNYEEELKNGISKEDFVIASGSMYSSDTFKRVGLFDSSYFIDLVDVEWCYRAKKYGLYPYVDKSISMNHNIGNNNYPTLFGKVVRIGPPIRQYFLVRNWVFSLKSSSFSFKRKVEIIILMITKVPLFLLCAPHTKRISCVFRGFFHGFINKVGSGS